jgi:O-antigen biosynthesis protein
MLMPPVPSGPELLVVYSHILTPDVDGGSLRMLNLISLLMEMSIRVTFVPDHPAAEHASDPQIQPRIARLRQAGVRVLTAPEIASVDDHLLREGSRYAIVLLSGSVYIAAKHVNSVRRHAPQAALWFDTLDLAHVREYRHARLLRNRPAIERALKTKKLELAVAAQADCTLVVSTVERQQLEQSLPGVRVREISNIHRVYGSATPFEQRRGLVFMGAFQHLPNLDAVEFFCGQVLPLLRADLPGMTLKIIGADPPAAVRALAAADVEITGHIADLASVYNTCRLSIAPLRFGAGVKGKVLLSLGYGVPVVGTHIAAEGSYMVDGENMRIADTPVGLANAIMEVYTQESVWNRLSENGLTTVQQHFSFDAARRQLHALLYQTLADFTVRSYS